MSAFSRLIDALTNKASVLIKEGLEGVKFELAIEDFAVQMAVNLIAGLISRCEFITTQNGEVVRGEEWYLWNVEPNCNQAKTAFISQLVRELIMKNEALAIENAGQIVIVNSFSKKEYALLPNQYKNIVIKDYPLSRMYSENEVLHFEYANKELQAQLSSVLYGYQKLMNLSLDKYKKSGNRKGVIELPTIKQGDKDRDEAEEKYFNERLAKFMNEAKNSVIGLPNGMKYTEINGASATKSSNEISDIVKIIEESFGRVSQALRLPKSLLMGDVANLDSALDEALTVCINPLASILQTEINRKRYGKIAYLKGYGLTICTNQIKHHDILDAAAAADKLIQDSLFNVDEIRMILGAVPLNTWWSKRYVITKNLTDTEKLTEEVKEIG